MNDYSVQASEIKYVSISRVADSQILLGVSAENTKKAYLDEVSSYSSF